MNTNHIKDFTVLFNSRWDRKKRAPLDGALDSAKKGAPRRKLLHRR